MEKVLNIYSDSVFVALGIQNATRMRHTVLCGLSGCTNFPTMFQKGHEFRKKKVIESKIYVLIFSTNLSEISLIIRRIDIYMFINVYWSLCKVLIAFFSRFNEN